MFFQHRRRRKFNPSTRIDYTVPQSGDITVAVYDITGRLVQTLVNGYSEAGYQTAVWNGRDSAGNSVSAGLYIYSLQSENITLTRKMVMMK